MSLLATEAWVAAKDAVVALRGRRYPERAEVVEGELVEVHGEVMAARTVGDEQAEQDLAAEWHGRLRRGGPGTTATSGTPAHTVGPLNCARCSSRPMRAALCSRSGAARSIEPKPHSRPSFTAKTSLRHRHLPMVFWCGRRPCRHEKHKPRHEVDEHHETDDRTENLAGGAPEDDVEIDSKGLLQ